MKGGCQSAQLELISGLPSKSALVSKAKCSLTINEPFIFAINDQDLEFNQIEGSLILAAEI